MGIPAKTPLEARGSKDDACLPQDPPLPIPHHCLQTNNYGEVSAQPRWGNIDPDPQGSGILIGEKEKKKKGKERKEK